MWLSGEHAYTESSPLTGEQEKASGLRARQTANHMSGRSVPDRKSSQSKHHSAVSEARPKLGSPGKGLEQATRLSRSRKRNKSTRATIQDVAQHAGVSKGTVSKFLNPNDGYYVSDSTRARIESAIKELDFQPSAIARGLTHNHTMTIGLVAADIRNPFYPDMVAGVQKVVEQEGYTLVLGSSGSDPDREQAIIRSMIRRRVDGVILGSARLQIKELENLTKSGTRVVLASRNLPEVVTDTVVIDNVAGGELAIDHLIGLGHRRIGHIAGPQDVVPFQNRLTGYRLALQRHGLEIEDGLILESRSTPESGAQHALKLLDRDDRPTALFVGNDNMALGAMDAARRLDLKIPDDVSIIGFDNIALSGNEFISLTTVDSEAQWIGEEAARVLLERLENGETPPYELPISIIRKPVLRVRRSTGPVKL